jgi:LacI family repressor for deo operon, udp, cdd, tsx, nupC, and nupG
MTDFDKITVNPRLEATLSEQIKTQLAWLIAIGQLVPGHRLPSVRQLARDLGVNMNTVRSAYQKLEADGLVETRQGLGSHVLVHYPSHTARRVGSPRSHTLGVILPGLVNPFYHAFLEGVEDVCRRDRTLLFVCSTHDDPGEALRYFAQLSAKRVDGIIVASQDLTHLLPQEPGLSEGRGPALPIVTVDWPGSPGQVVLIDLESAGYQATTHLLEHGHHRVGLITFAFDMPNVRPVEMGYARALRGAGLESDPALVARVQGFDEAAGAEGAQILLSLPQPPTAVFAIADMLAIGAMRALKAAGKRVPDDVALAGFNDIPLAALVDPPLTTVQAPARRMGHEAMKMLDALIAGRRPRRRRVILPTSLVVRQSCGPHEAASSEL